MDAVFLTILNLGIKGSWLILTVFFVRLFLKRTPKRVICLLWGLALFRLICPFSVKSVFSLIPSAEVIPSDIALSHQPQIDSGIPVINDTLNPVIAETFAPDPFTSVNPLQVVVFVCRIVWLGGIAVMLVWALASWLKLKKTVRASIPAGEEVMVCDEIRAPFILGVFRPLIYVPSFLEEETADLVVRHEKAHLERGDHWWKPLGFLVLTLHWFNPLCWMAYILLCRDIESACDEKVIRDMDREQVAAYSRALLDCSYPRRMVNACPLAFGEAGVKARVTGVLRYKKPSFLITVTAVVVCLVIAVCLMTDPFSDRSLPEKLRVSLDIAAAEHNRSPYTDGHFTAVSHDVMRVSGPAGETTVYAWILYEEYSFDGTDVRVGSGSYIPCAVTFDTSADNSDTSVYPVIEYWEPRDGSYYAEDIRAKFPLSIRRKAFDASGSEALHENNVRKAREYFGAVSGNGVPDQMTWLKEKYPEYFDLPADRGLTVFVREADEEQYLCALAVTGGKEKTAEEVREMNGTSAEEMRMILSSYDISREMITVTAYSDSLPGHSFEADEALAERVQ